MRTKPHRKTRRRFEIHNQPRFVTFSCYDRLPLLFNDAISDLFVDRLLVVRELHQLKLHAFVVMPEHVHLLVTPSLPDHPLPRVLRSLKAPVAQAVLSRWRELTAPILERITDNEGTARLWQRGGGYDRNVRTPEEFVEKANYIHANPVRRGLVESPTDWAWSSAGALAGENSDVVLDPMPS